MRKRARRGFTLLEMMTVLAIIGITAAMAIPQMRQAQANGRLRGLARDTANVFHLARQRAITTGNNHVVYFSSSAGPQDLCTNPFPLDPTTGAAYPILLVDDGPPGPASNCCIDANEIVWQVPPQQGVRWGVTAGIPAFDDDGGTGNHTLGNTFTLPGGGQAHAVLFRPDGVPVAVGAACASGQVGSGTGGVYVTNNQAPAASGRNYSIVLSPLGGVKVYAWDQGMNGGVGAWTN